MYGQIGIKEVEESKLDVVEGECLTMAEQKGTGVLAVSLARGLNFPDAADLQDQHLQVRVCLYKVSFYWHFLVIVILLGNI